MRGSITRVSRKDGSGSILAEDGKEVCFERSEARIGVDELRVGHWVEFELQYGFEQSWAVNVKPVQRDAGQRPGTPIGSKAEGSRYGHKNR